MNKLKEIYLTIFTFPRYTLWKRTGQDKWWLGLPLLYVVVALIAIFSKTALFFITIYLILQAMYVWANFIEMDILTRGDKS